MSAEAVPRHDVPRDVGAMLDAVDETLAETVAGMRTVLRAAAGGDPDPLPGPLHVDLVGETETRLADTYFPSNGALLLAVGMMAAGWQGSTGHAPGFPAGWSVRVEGIRPLP